MTDQQPQRAKTAYRAGPAITSGLFVVLPLIPSCYLLLLALMTRSEGPWDTTVTDMVRAEAVGSIFFAAIAATVTTVAGRMGWLPHPRWWLLPSAACVLAAVFRIILAPHP